MNQIFTTTPQDAAQLLYESFYQPHVKSLANYNLVSPDYGQHNVEPIKSVFNQTLISVPANNFQLIMSMFVVYGLATYLCLLIIKPIKQTCVLM